MKLKSLIAIVALTLFAQGAIAQPKSRIQAQAEAEKKAETSLSERAKAQYTAQMPAPTDVVWKRDIYRTLDMTKEKNAALYYPVEPLGDRVNLFTLIIRLVADGKVPAYEYRSDGNELFTEDNKYKVTDMLDKFYIYYEEKDGKLTIADSDIPSGEVLSYFIKESSFYDQRTATYTTRVTAICPVLHRSGDFGSETTKYPMFWLNYDEVSPYFGMTPLMTSSYNNVSNMSIAHGDVGMWVELTLEKIAHTTHLKSLAYDFVWTERAALSRRGDFRIIPSDTLPADLTPESRQRMQRAIASERTLVDDTLR